LQQLSAAVPLTYGLRAMRRLLLTGASPTDVWNDAVILAIFAAVLMFLGSVAFAAALRHSRRFGTLAQY
jgi:ABC-type multidrug transport system permease subunit